MGYNEMDKVWEYSQAAKTDKLVLLAIARRYNPGKGSWPSQKTLAKACGVSDRAVRVSINKLQVLGELVWVRGNSSGKANTYLISFLESEMTKTSALDIQKLPLKVTKTSAQNDKNFRPLNKELNILDKQEIVRFESATFTPLFWKSCDVSLLPPLRVAELLKAFEDSWECRKAYTEDMRLSRWWTYLDNAKREDN